MKSITWKIGGEAGFGIMTTGLAFSRIATRQGYHIYDYVEYPSLIRGGHNVYEVRVSDEKVFAQEYGIDVLIALNKETVDLHKEQMKPGSIILYDGEQFSVTPEEIGKSDVVLLSVPFSRLVKEAGGLPVMVNNLALAASLAVLSMDITPMFELIADAFAKKGQEVIDQNKKVAQAGYDFVKKNFPPKFAIKLELREKQNHMVVSGNEAVGMGALAANCKLYVAYPMTPTSNLLHFLASAGPKQGMVVKHAEDEISVINMAIGGGYAGVRSMVGTAGGGFSLMVEGVGLAGVTETPLVIVEGMRPGPATGMPTWTGQGDLQFILHAAQDEFPRAVFAPGDMTEAFELTAQAFNVAEKYQMPVFILIDKYLAEGHQSMPFPDISKVTIDRGKLMSWQEGDTVTDYLRYKITDDGIPVRALPGMKGAVFLANSYEHDQYGWTSEKASHRNEQVERRFRKLATYARELPPQNLYGDVDADLTIVAWGSTKGPVLQAIQELKAEGFEGSVNFLHITHLWPFPVASVSTVLQKARKTLLIEGNFTAQMGLLIREQTGIAFEQKYLRYDGRPFYPEDITKKIKEMVI